MKNNTILSSCIAATLAAALLTPVVVRAQTVQTTTTTSAAGMITEFNPGMITVHSETSAAPLQYASSKTTTYVDEAGNPVSVETVKSGLPVQVYYTRVGDVLVADRVIVKRAVIQAPPAQVIVQPPAQVIEKKTTTTITTEK